jgi:hypothetical protein
MAQPQHLIVPFAFTGDPASGTPPLAPWPMADRLSGLARLLARAQRCTWHTGPLETPVPPHEWALALALGARPSLPRPLPADGTLPWAAWTCPEHLPTPDTPAAWFLPAHQEVGMSHVKLHAPDRLALDDDTSRALASALAPLAAEDGIALTWVSAGRWLATGEVFRGLACASPDRAASPSLAQDIAPWLHRLPPLLRRLQTEAQMLFYTHPAHDRRVAQGLAPVNTFWIAGSGTGGGAHLAPPEGVAVAGELRLAALAADPLGWTQAWTALDTQVLPAWLARADRGEHLAVHLCGERSVCSLHLAPTSLPQAFAHRISSFLKPDRMKYMQSLL